MNELGQSILSLRQTGRSYRQISLVLGCSLSTISYYCGEGQKEKAATRRDNKRLIILKSKMDRFRTDKPITKGKTSRQSSSTLIRQKIRRFHRHADKMTHDKISFTFEDLQSKVGENPTCYLTGVPIDLQDPLSYELDHIVPRSKGGTNTLDNLGLASKQANRAKGNMGLDEFIALCAAVTNHVTTE